MTTKIVKLKKYIDSDNYDWKIIEDPLVKIPEWLDEQREEWLNRYTTGLMHRIEEEKIIAKMNKECLEDVNTLLVENKEGKQLLIIRDQILDAADNC